MPGIVVQEHSNIVASFMNRVYFLMAIALVITGVTAFYLSSSPGLFHAIMGNRMVFYGLIIAQLGLVVVISAGISKLSPGVATLAFVVYSVLTGIVFSTLFIIYTHSSIYSVFLICALTFLVLSVYGMVTKRDLTGMGRFMMMGLVGILIASIVNMFLKLPSIYWITSYIGVAVFAGLTAYDTQKLKNLAYELDNADSALVAKYSVVGALTLYLDFINMFLMLLRIMGSRK